MWCCERLCFWPTLWFRGVASPLDSPEHFLSSFARNILITFLILVAFVARRGCTLLPSAGISVTLFHKSSLNSYLMMIECWCRNMLLSLDLSRPLSGRLFIQSYPCWPFKDHQWKCRCVMWGNMLRHQMTRVTGLKLFIWGILNWRRYVIRSLGGILWA